MPFELSTTNLIIFGGVAFGLIGFFVLFLKGIFEDEDEEKDFEPKRIDTMLEPEVRELGSFYGQNISVPIRYNYSKIGRAYKSVQYTGNIDREDDNDSRIDKESLEDAVENDEISERMYELLDTNEQEPVNVLFVRSDTKLFGVIPIDKFVFNFWKALGKEKNVSKVLIIPDRLLRSDNKYLSIDASAEMTRFAGMDVAKEPSSFHFIENIVYRQLYEQAIEDQKNYHDKVNFYDSNFSQSIQELKAEAEAEKSKWESKGTSMVEED